LLKGTSGPRNAKGTIPTTTKLTETYIRTDISKDPIMPAGMVVAGLITSSDRQDTMSNPRYEKNTSPAPLATPETP